MGGASGGGGASAFAGYSIATASFLDGTSTHWEQARDIAFDAQGNLVVVGGTSSSDFPTTAGTYDRTYGDGTAGVHLGGGGQTDVFVTKINPQGQILWSTFVGGHDYDRAYAVEIARTGDIIIAGRAGDGFPVTAGTMQTTFAGDTTSNSEYGWQDGFVASLTADGKTLNWATYFGDAGPGFIRDIALDAQDRIHLAASTFTNVPAVAPMAWGAQATPRGVCDSLYGVLSADGTKLLFGDFIGGADTATYSANPSVRVGPDGDIYVMTYDPSSNVGGITQGAYQPASGGGFDVVLTRYAPDHSVKYRTYYGGSGDELLETHTLAVDAAGRAIISGATKSTNLPVTSGVFQATNRGGTSDAFVAILSADGRNLVAATYLGGNGDEEVEGIGVAANGDIVVGGHSSSTDLQVTAGVLNATTVGTDGYVGRLTPDLKTRLFLRYVGGAGSDNLRSVATDASGRVAYAGVTGSRDLPLVNAQDSTLNTDTGSSTQGAYYLLLNPL